MRFNFLVNHYPEIFIKLQPISSFNKNYIYSVKYKDSSEPPTLFDEPNLNSGESVSTKPATVNIINETRKIDKLVKELERQQETLHNSPIDKELFSNICTEHKQNEIKDDSEEVSKLKEQLEVAEKLTLKLLVENYSEPKFYLQSLIAHRDISATEKGYIIKLYDKIINKILTIKTKAFNPPHTKINTPADAGRKTSSSRQASVSTKRLKWLERCTEIVENMINFTKRKRHIASPFSRRIIGTALAHCGISFYAAEIFYAAAIRAFLHNINYTITGINDKIAASFIPSRTSFAQYVYETAAEKLAWLRKEIIGKKLYMSCDKGNKKGIGHFIKFICFWDARTKQVKVYLLDCDASEGTSKDCAAAINFSLTRLDSPENFTKLYGQNTDAGGGGVGTSLAKELDSFDRIYCILSYLHPTCSLHGHQLVLSNPVKKLIGDGGLGKQNALQLLHSIYNLQTGGGGTFEVSEFKKIWKSLFNEDFSKITEPVLTRWWTIGAAVKQVLPDLEKWAAVALKCADAYPTIAAPNQCASAITCMISQPIIEAHLRWIDAFHESWWSPHFVWLSAVDETSKQPSFRAHHMAAHTLIMGRELRDLSEKWNTHPSFGKYLKVKETIKISYHRDCLYQLETQFFEIAMKSFHKHFNQWIKPPLLPAMIGGEKEIATMFAKWIIQGTYH